MASDLDNLLRQLREAGQAPDRALLDQIAAVGLPAASQLVAMAIDEELHTAGEDSPAVWAPLHAIQLLGEIGAVEAIAPLLPLFAWEYDDWLAPVLQEAFGRLGQPTLGPLRTLLFDRTQDWGTRSAAAGALAQVAQHHAELRGDAIAVLVARLDPAESQAPEDETLNAFVITELLDLRAEEAAEAIRRAFDEDRVDLRVVNWADAQRNRDEPFEAMLTPPNASEGMRLWLTCTVCHYDRPHEVGTVYYDILTAAQLRQDGEPHYSEFVITRRITCPKCGAVDQYEMTADALLALTGELIQHIARRESGAPEDPNSPLQFVEFGLGDGRTMHPYAARDLYHQQVAEEPNRVDLRVRYANVLRFLGYRTEALAQYQAAIERDPNNVEAHHNLGLLFHQDGDWDNAQRMFERVLVLPSPSRLPRETSEAYLDFARKALAELAGDSSSFGRLLVAATRPPGAIEARAQTTTPRAVRKVGRNDPCPCGSGQKYKRCCGR